MAKSIAAEGAVNVRFGSKADIASRPEHVRCTLRSGHGSRELTALIERRV